MKKGLQEQFKDSGIVFLFLIIAGILTATPLQHYIPLSRFQHFGLGIFLVGLGYVIQTVWSWKRMKTWARAMQLYFGLWFAATGLVAYSLPWLDPKMSVRTESQEKLASSLVIAYFVSCAPLPVLTLLWLREELQNWRKTRKDSTS
ncbi:MAG TPA: hypothetical protein V6D08_16815 [Candidatus Obscuribacterales bacterium]